eukprot:2486181-Pleurochrysis_carterae.AAC.8
MWLDQCVRLAKRKGLGDCGPASSGDLVGAGVKAPAGHSRLPEAGGAASRCQEASALARRATCAASSLSATASPLR